jgi:CrcB protein
MMSWALVFLGGGLGSLLRHAAAEVAQRLPGEPGPGRFPYATLAVNVLGCLLIGFAAEWCADREPARALFVVGILGGFTTFSSFGLDTVRLLSAGEVGKAVAYVLLTVAAGLFAVWVTYESGFVDAADALRGD